ncbi:MAG: ABC transporter ATP-binding protein, partial [Anaerococcus obesiensis]
GSGKSVESYGIMGLLQEPGKVKSGKILYKGENVLDYDKNKMSEFRGAKCSMIFQNPMTCLNPVYTIGNQLMEALLVHKKCSKDEAYQKAVEMLDSVGISNPKRRMKQYPHELSGGMRQRVMIGMGLICEPDILIADEPTTALDVTIQAQILELIKEFQNKSKMSVIFITHNLAVVAQICDTVSVMYAGRIVEQGSVEEIFYNPKHPYTKGLLKSMPRIDSKEQVRLESIKGTPVDMLNPPEGCGFSTRCEHCMNICLKKEPPMLEMGNGHRSKCFLHIKESINGR